MVEVLEEQLGKSVSLDTIPSQAEYSPKNPRYSEQNYSAFAEMHLEKPSNVQAAKVTCTVCTWRGIPTIDDW